MPSEACRLLEIAHVQSVQHDNQAHKHHMVNCNRCSHTTTSRPVTELVAAPTYSTSPSPGPKVVSIIFTTLTVDEQCALPLSFPRVTGVHKHEYTTATTIQGHYLRPVAAVCTLLSAPWSSTSLMVLTGWHACCARAVLQCG
jgi:hypothetical protein